MSSARCGTGKHAACLVPTQPTHSAALWTTTKRKKVKTRGQVENDPTAWRGLRGIPEHGTRGRYVRGCRCSICREKLRDYSKAYRAAHRKPRKTRSDKGVRRPNTQHGTHSSYGRGCRCRPCKDAHAAAMRATTGYKRRPERTPALLSERQASRRERLRAYRSKTSTVDTETRGYAALLELDPCSYCGSGAPNTVDHIVPVSAEGAHRWDNLTAACGRCNSSKGAKPLLVFLAARAA